MNATLSLLEDQEKCRNRRGQNHGPIIQDQLCVMATNASTSETENKNIVENETLSFSHNDLIEITKTTLNEVLQRDSLLSDLPPDVTEEEVRAQIALEHGQSMTVYVVRGDGEELPVVVKHKDSTVLDLKRAIRRHLMWQMNRQKQRVKISWKYIWRTYHLQYDSERLTKNETLLSEIGIRNRSKVNFVKRLREKGMLVQKDV